jgi:hypothetical protein
MKMNVMISGMNFLILNKYWECPEITEYLKFYSWSKHVKQINELLMAMRNMWWHFRFLFGQTVFLNCLTECQTSCLWFSICLLQWWYWRIKKITEKLLSQELRPVFGVNGLKLCILAISWHLIMILKTLSWRASFQIFSLIPKHISTRNLHGPNVLSQPIRNQFSYYYHMLESIFGVDISETFHFVENMIP